MTQTEARWVFLVMFGRLVRYAKAHGHPFIVTCFHRGAIEQATMVATGKSKVRHSQHQDWLAADVVIVKPDGTPVWEHKRGDAYEKLGVFWEQLSPHLRWGGRFGRTDEKLGWDPYHFEVCRDSVEKVK